MKKIPILLFLVLLCHSIKAQQAGAVSYEKLGLSFQIPDGWLGQESDGMYLMGSNSKAGLIIIQPHQLNKEALKKQARQGIQEGQGTYFQLEGDIQNLNDNAIGGFFTGMMDWEKARAYIIGIPKPFTYNPGITITAVTTPNLFDNTYKDHCLSILNSVKFKEVDRKQEMTQWKQLLSNMRLTYMESYYSGSATADMPSGGYSKTKTIDLCGKGYFNYAYQSSVSVDASGAYGSSESNNNGNGNWELFLNDVGNPALQLNFYDGEIQIYELNYQNQELYLDGYRYYITNSGEDAPNCY
jgi:hypothetical protein